jgi:hypothetical protein
LFPLFGAGAVFAGLYLPKQTKNTQPEQITFDHDKGAVVVEMTKGGDQRGYIRYDEIAGYDIYVESRRSSGSGRSSSRTYYHYHVYIKKKDGGEWHLFNYSDRNEADAMIVKLNLEVPLDKPFNVSTSAKLSPKIEKKEGLDKTIIHWQNKVGIGQPIFLVVFSIIFLSIAFSFISFDAGGMDYFFYIVIGFILTIFCFVMFTVARKLIKDATTRYAVSVDHTNLEYFEFAKNSGRMKNQKTLPLKTVHSISYTFSPSSQYQDAGLKILTSMEAQRTEEYEKKPFQALKDAFTGKNQPIKFSINALNPVECLQLENWLQELILKKGNVSVR